MTEFAKPEGRWIALNDEKAVGPFDLCSDVSMAIVAEIINEAHSAAVKGLVEALGGIIEFEEKRLGIPIEGWMDERLIAAKKALEDYRGK